MPVVVQRGLYPGQFPVSWHTSIHLPREIHSAPRIRGWGLALVRAVVTCWLGGRDRRGAAVALGVRTTVDIPTGTIALILTPGATTCYRRLASWRMPRRLKVMFSFPLPHTSLAAATCATISGDVPSVESAAVLFFFFSSVVGLPISVARGP